MILNKIPYLRIDTNQETNSIQMKSRLFYIIIIFIALIVVATAGSPAAGQAPSIIDQPASSVVPVLPDEEKNVSPGGDPIPSADAVDAQKKDKTLSVVIKLSEPFVIFEAFGYSGFCVKLWEKIAEEMGVEYELYTVPTIAKLLADVVRGEADLAISGIGLTSEREEYLDFSYAFFESGLQIMISREYDSPLSKVMSKVFSVIFSRSLIYIIVFFLIILFISANLIWLFERKHNPQFPKSYLKGIWESFWWAAVTITTVGYGDKSPRGKLGRVFALLWMFTGYFIFAYFTASVTTTVTIQEIQGIISGPEDLFGKKVATVKGSTAADYLTEHGITPIVFKHAESAFQVLEDGLVDALVYDSPVLLYHASKKGKGKVKVVGPLLQVQKYAIAVQKNSPYREEINLAFLRLIENGVYQEIYERWFGSSTGL